MEVKLLHFGTEHALEIDEEHYIRRLGMPKDYDFSEDVEKSMAWAVKWYNENGNPWVQFYELDVRLEDGNLYLNERLVEAPKVYKRFKKYNVQKAMLIASTAGDSVDKKTANLWSSDYPDRSFFLDTYAASVTEAIVAFSVDEIKVWLEQKALNSLARYSPGYPGWGLKGQILLMDIINSIETQKIPITVSETALLNPLKSQLSLIGIYEGEKQNETIEIECLQCTFMDCNCRTKGIFIKK